jgi:hypothetical protein
VTLEAIAEQWSYLLTFRGTEIAVPTPACQITETGKREKKKLITAKNMNTTYKHIGYYYKSNKIKDIKVIPFNYLVRFAA